MILIVLLFYVGTLMPFKVAFLEDNDTGTWLVVDILSDLVFMCDLFVSSLSAYYDDEGMLITNNKRIFYHYAKGWFCADLIASIPISLMSL